MVATTVEGFRPTAGTRGIALVLRLPGSAEDVVSDAVLGEAAAPLSPSPVTADPDRLAQLLANLLENALTFARSTVRVTVADSPGTEACVITVDDDGPGIARGDLERVFERFYQADRGPNRRMGSGLGLAIVTELAAAMGGSVTAESPLGVSGGSRFVVTLRRWPAPVPGPTGLPAPA